jgi:hypothetical protein
MADERLKKQIQQCESHDRQLPPYYPATMRRTYSMGENLPFPNLGTRWARSVSGQLYSREMRFMVVKLCASDSESKIRKFLF